jgi:O-antigen/teichoic acid export membrane protein
VAIDLGRRTFITLVWSFISLPLTAFVSIAVVPKYLEHLGQGHFGTVLLAQQVAGIAGSVIPNPAEAMMQRLAAAYGAEDRERMRTVLGSSRVPVLWSAGIMLVFAALVLGVSALLPQKLWEVGLVIAVFLLSASVRALSEAATALLSALQRPQLVGGGSAVANLAAPLLGLLFLNLNMGVVAIPIAQTLVWLVFAIVLFARFASVEPELVKNLPPFDRAFFQKEIWPLARSRWLAVIPSTLGLNVDRVLTVVSGGSRLLVTTYTLTARLPDLLSTVLPTIAVAAVPALAYASDSKKRDVNGAARDLLAVVVALAAGASGACISVLKPFLALWVPTVEPLGPLARTLMCIGLFGRILGVAGAAILNGRGKNHHLPRLSWIYAIATLAFGIGLGKAFGVEGVAIALGAVAFLVLMPLMLQALAAEDVLDRATAGRFAAITLACAAAGLLAPDLTLRLFGDRPGWGPLLFAVTAAGIATMLAMFAVDASSRRRLLAILARGSRAR